MKSLVVIPTYNERDNIEKLSAEIQKIVPDTDLLVVDDNSPDGTGELVDNLAKKNHQIHVLHRPGKAGLGRAYQAGFQWALDHSYDLICSMDADFSHQPKYLPTLLKIAEEGAGVAVGSRYTRGGKVVGWTWDRYVLSWGANLLTKFFLGLTPHDVTAGFKCYRREFLESFDLDSIVSPGYAFQVEMLMQAQKNGFKIIETPITFQDRTVGQSKVSKSELLTSARSLYELTLRRQGLKEMARFGAVGTLNLIIDLGLTNVLILVGVPAQFAGYIGTAIALINSFIWNRSWTFEVKEGKLAHQFVRFLLVNGSGAAIHLAIYTVLLLNFHWHYNAAKIVAILFVMAWNFIGTKYWAFRKK